MASRRRGYGWIIGLRRDRGLFALLGALVLIVNAFQPLAVANAGAFAGLRVVCSRDHVEADASGGGRPSHAPGSTECPCCIGGACPVVHGPAKGMPVESVSFDPARPRPGRGRHPTRHDVALAFATARWSADPRPSAFRLN